MRNLTYIIGIPASGKSTAMRNALKGVEKGEDVPQPFPFTWHRKKNLIVLGKDREEFSGTDAMAYSVMPKVLDFIKDPTTRPDTILGEGDRLANDNFFKGCFYGEWDLNIVLIDTPPAIAERRCFQRRSKQSASWRAGRITKVNKLVRRWRKYITVIDGLQSEEDIAEQLKSLEGFKRIHGE